MPKHPAPSATGRPVKIIYPRPHGSEFDEGGLAARLESLLEVVRGAVEVRAGNEAAEQFRVVGTVRYAGGMEPRYLVEEVRGEIIKQLTSEIESLVSQGVGKGKWKVSIPVGSGIRGATEELTLNLSISWAKANPTLERRGGKGQDSKREIGKLKVKQVAKNRGEETKDNRVQIEDYEAAYRELLEERRAFFHKVSSQFVPKFNGVVRAKWEQERPATLDKRTEFIEWVESQLDGLGLTILDVKTKRPAVLRTTGSCNEWRIVPVGSNNASMTRTDLSDLLPLEVTVAGRKRPGAAETILLSSEESKGKSGR